MAGVTVTVIPSATQPYVAIPQVLQSEYLEALFPTLLPLSSTAGLAVESLTAALRASALRVQGHGHCPAIPYETTACTLGIVLPLKEIPGPH